MAAAASCQSGNNEDSKTGKSRHTRTGQHVYRPQKQGGAGMPIARYAARSRGAGDVGRHHWIGLLLCASLPYQFFDVRGTALADGRRHPCRPGSTPENDSETLIDATTSASAPARVACDKHSHFSSSLRCPRVNGSNHHRSPSPSNIATTGQVMCGSIACRPSPRPSIRGRLVACLRWSTTGRTKALKRHATGQRACSLFSPAAAGGTRATRHVLDGRRHRLTVIAWQPCSEAACQVGGSHWRKIQAKCHIGPPNAGNVVGTLGEEPGLVVFECLT